MLYSIFSEARSEHIGADGFSRIGNAIWYLSTGIPKAITYPQWFISLIGIFFLLRKKIYQPTILIGFFVFFIEIISLLSLHQLRWTIPVLPVLAVFAAVALDWLTSTISTRWGKLSQKTLFIVLLIVISVWPLTNTILHDIRQLRPSTHLLARDWIINNIAPGARILQEYYVVPISDLSYKCDEQFSIAGAANYYEYEEKGYHYLIVNSWIYERFFLEPERYSDQEKFYRHLFTEGDLVKELKPTIIDAGPTIRIYKLTPDMTFIN